jgi:hypothetical protein
MNLYIQRFVAQDTEARRCWINFVEEKTKTKSVKNAAFGGANQGGASPTSPKSLTVPALHIPPRQDSVDSGRDKFNQVTIGYSIDPQQDSKCDVGEESKMSEFRLNVRTTQMFAFMLSKLEFEPYEPYLNGLGYQVDRINDPGFEQTIENYLWKGASAQSVLASICDDFHAILSEESPDSGDKSRGKMARFGGKVQYRFFDDDGDYDEHNVDRNNNTHVRRDDETDRSSYIDNNADGMIRTTPIDVEKPTPNDGSLFGTIMNTFKRKSGAKRLIGEHAVKDRPPAAMSANHSLAKEKMKLLQHVATSNRRCDEELHQEIVEVSVHAYIRRYIHTHICRCARTLHLEIRIHSSISVAYRSVAA